MNWINFSPSNHHHRNHHNSNQKDTESDSSLAQSEDARPADSGSGPAGYLIGGARANVEDTTKKKSMEKENLNLILKLVNETSLLLPLSDCNNVIISSKKQTDKSKSREIAQVERGDLDLCRVDWAQAKLVRAQDYLRESNLPSILELSPKTGIERSSKNKSHQQTPSSPLNQHDNNHHNTRSPSPSHSPSLWPLGGSGSERWHLLATNNRQQQKIYPSKLLPFSDSALSLSYLSLSSLLSLCGLFINLFIILIIIFNTQQRRRNSNSTRSAAGGNSCQNNSLLFQLTITGLVLSSFVLIENYNLYVDNLHRRDSNETTAFLFQSSNEQIALRPYWTILSIFPTWLPQITDKKQDFWDDTHETGSNLPETSEELKSNQLMLLVRLDKKGSSLERTRLVRESTVPTFERIKVREIRLVRKLSHQVGRIFDRGEGDTEKEEADQSKQRKRHVVRNVLNQRDYGHEAHAWRLLFSWQNLIGLMINVVASVHIWTVASLAYDRYYAISNPLQYLRSYHHSKRTALSLVTWSLSIAFGLLTPLSLQMMTGGSVGGGNEIKSEFQNFSHPIQLYKSSIDSPEELFQVDEYDKDNLTTNSPAIGVEKLNRLRRVVESGRADGGGQYAGSAARILTTLSMMIVNNRPTPTIRIGENSGFAPEGITSSFQAEGFPDVCLLFTLSMICFAAIVLAPLSMITICNICIYKIVKLHQRRQSLTSLSNGGGFSSASASGNCHPLNSQGYFKSFISSNGNGDDNKSEAGSLTSALIGKLTMFKASNRQPLPGECKDACLLFNSNRPDESVFDPEHGSLLLQAQCECENEKRTLEQTAAESDPCDETGSITNRSRRLVERQDSYQKIMASIKQKNANNQTMKPVSCPSANGPSNSTANMEPQLQKIRLKRKISDHSLISSSRKNSSASYNQDYAAQGQQFDVEGSLTDCPHSLLNHDTVTSSYKAGSILDQLKMAGLSFAGIPLTGNCTRLLSKSNSLANLSGQHHQQQQPQHGHSDLPPEPVHCRSSLDSCQHQFIVGGSHHRRSFVSLNSSSNFKFGQQQTSALRCSTKLLPDMEFDPRNRFASSLNLPFNSDHHNHHPQHHHHRHHHPTMMSTKSAVFNMAIWMILLTIVITLSHYCLVIASYLVQLRDYKIESIEREIIKFISTIRIKSLEQVQQQPEPIADRREPLREMLLLFSCLWRITFMAIIPLNCWLYGVRSRSLKNTISMVLKRYISRKQASIEIGARQRSLTTSIRSRESSSLLSFQQQQQRTTTNSIGTKKCQCNIDHYLEASRRASVNSDRCGSIHSMSIMSSSKSPRCSQNTQQPSVIPGPSIRRHTSSRVLADRSLSVDDGASDCKQTMAEHGRTPSIKFLIDQYDSCNSIVEPSQTNHSKLLQSPGTSLGSSLTSSSRSITSGNSSLASSLITEESSLQFRKASLANTSEEGLSISEAGSCMKVKFSLNSDQRTFRDVTRVPVSNYDRRISTDSAVGLLSGSEKWSISREGSEMQMDTQKSAFALNDEIQTKPDDDTSFKAKKTQNSTKFKRSSLSRSPPKNERPQSETRGEVRFYITSERGQKGCNQNGASVRADSSEESESKGERPRMLDSLYEQLRSGPLADMFSSNSRKKCSSSSKNVSSNSSQKLRPFRKFGRSSVREKSSGRVQLVKQMRNSLTSESLRSHSSCLGQVGGNTSWCSSMKHSHFQAGSSVSIGASSLSRAPCDSQPDVKLNKRNSNEIKQQHQMAAGSHLKPPNFLNLIFDGNPQSDGYAISSALSPIKECSSNHSYASSQSSLNNSSSANQQQQVIDAGCSTREPPTVDMRPMPD